MESKQFFNFEEELNNISFRNRIKKISHVDSKQNNYDSSNAKTEDNSPQQSIEYAENINYKNNKCTTCGAELQPNANFCVECGAHLQ